MRQMQASHEILNNHRHETSTNRWLNDRRLTKRDSLGRRSGQRLKRVAHVAPGYGVVGTVLLGERLAQRRGVRWDR